MIHDKLFNTPILFITYRNPEITRLTFDRIRKIKPRTLYLASDGPKLNSSNKVLNEINETRSIIKNIDWDCNVHTKFEKKNLGCKYAVYSAISWFFDNEEQGIILEYDCLPDLTFFTFCETLLEKYKNNDTIFSISGNNFDFGYVNNLNKNKNSYYFSHISKLWGWAAWSRSWKYFDIELSDFTDFRDNNSIDNLIYKKKHRKYWIDKINQVYLGINNSTWGFIWLYTLFKHNAYCITPNVNLVSNIGFGEEATHAKDKTSLFSNIKAKSINLIEHPLVIEPNFKSDTRFTELLYQSEYKSIMKRIRNYINKSLKT